MREGPAVTGGGSCVNCGTEYGFATEVIQGSDLDCLLHPIVSTRKGGRRQGRGGKGTDALHDGEVLFPVCWVARKVRSHGETLAARGGVVVVG